MKSKISCYDSAVSHVTLKRFAPVSVLYTIILLVLTIGTAAANYRSGIGNMLSGIRSMCCFAPIINLIYAAVLAQLLLGDLYTPRLGYALYSMPITLGGWFGTQVILGIVSIFPGIILSSAIMLVRLASYRIVIPYFIGTAVFSFLFFFGIALLSAVCAGNRIGMILLYSILNFGGLFFSWARIRIFCPLIYGIYLPNYTSKLSPIVNILSRTPFDINFKDEEWSSESLYQPNAAVESIEFSSFLWNLLAYAAVGIIIIALSSRLLRRRKAECAGDLLAFRKTEPILLVACSAFCGILFHAISYYFAWGMGYPMLLIGMAIGYYAMLMLLQRRTDVFTKKSVAPLVLIEAVFFAAITAVGLNLFGITYRIPEAEDVAQVQIRLLYESGTYTSSDESGIQTAIQIQEECLSYFRKAEQTCSLPERIYGNKEDIPYAEGDESLESSPVTVCYTMKDGSKLNRCYYILESFACIDSLRDIFSAPEYVLDGAFLDENGQIRQDALSSGLYIATLSCWHEFQNGTSEYSTNCRISSEDLPGLIEAILKDCEENTMAQSWILHCGDPQADSIDISVYDAARGYEISSCYLNVYASNVNTLNYLIAHGYHSELSW